MSVQPHVSALVLTESLAFLRSSSSSPGSAAGSTTSVSKHVEPREELFCWYMISWDTASLGLPCVVSSGLLPVAPEAAPRGCIRGRPSALVPGTASPPPPDLVSPSKEAGGELDRLGCDDENTRSNCFFFLLNIHSPDSFLLPSAPPAPRRSDPTFGLSQGFAFPWKFFQILRWQDSCPLPVPSSLGDFCSMVPVQQPASLSTHWRYSGGMAPVGCCGSALPPMIGSGREEADAQCGDGGGVSLTTSRVEHLCRPRCTCHVTHRAARLLESRSLF